MKTINQLRQEYIDTKTGEQIHLGWIDALFTTIKDDIKSGDIHKAQKLADLGQYLAQDLQHYSEDELAQLLADKEGLWKPTRQSKAANTPSAKATIKNIEQRVSRTSQKQGGADDHHTPNSHPWKNPRQGGLS